LNVANALGDRLVVTIEDAAILENGGSTTATVTRSGSLSSDLTITLANSDTSEISIPTGITIARNETSATFPVTGVDDDLEDGTQKVAITATATGYLSGSATLSVRDDDQPPPPDGLVGWWKFDETAGTVAQDSAWDDNGGLLVGNTAFADDSLRGRVLSLSNANDRVSLEADVDLGASWTIAGWFRGLAAGTWRTLSRGAGGDHQIIVDSNGELGSYDNVGGTQFRGSGFNVNSLDSG
jgi:hypothetical protein